MFLDRERPRVKLHAEDRHVGNVECPDLANGEAQKLRYELFIKRGAQHGVKVPEASSHEARTELIDTEGYLKKKNWLIPGIRTAQMIPRTQARKVEDGIVGSSVLATADRTSGYGDSSSSIRAVESKLGSSSMSVVTRYQLYQAIAVSCAKRGKKD